MHRPWEVHSKDLASWEYVPPASEWVFLPILVNKSISYLRGHCPLQASSHGLKNYSLGFESQPDLLKEPVAYRFHRGQSKFCQQEQVLHRLYVSSEKSELIDFYIWAESLVWGAWSQPAVYYNFTKYRASKSQLLRVFLWEGDWRLEKVHHFQLWKHLLFFTLFADCLVKD